MSSGTFQKKFKNNVRIKKKNSQIVHPNRLRTSHIKPASN